MLLYRRTRGVGLPEQRQRGGQTEQSSNFVASELHLRLGGRGQEGVCVFFGLTYVFLLFAHPDLRPATAEMEPTAPETQRYSGSRAPGSMGSGRRRRVRACSSRSERRTNRWPRLTFRDLPRLLGAAVFAATVALRGSALASSNPLELNGGSCLAMAGKGCVALAVDRRFGLEGQLVSTEAKRVLKVRHAVRRAHL